MVLVPLSEGLRVDGDDGSLDEGLRSHHLVTGRVEHGVDDTGLASALCKTASDLDMA